MNKDDLKNEVIKCGRDPVYFIKNYVKIKHPVRGLIKFDLFDYQEEMIQNLLMNRFNAILKARQLGISECVSAYAVWLILFHKNKNVLILATKADTAKNIITRMKTAFKNLPKWMMLADIDVNNKMSVELSNGSVAKAIPASTDAGRSEAVSLLIVDEAAHIENMDDIWTGVLPTVQAGGRAIVMSTPNGVGNTFHKICSEAENGQNDFKIMKLPWWRHPERTSGLTDDPERPGFKTSPWFKKETKNMDSRDIAQELECNFNASGLTFLSSEVLDYTEAGCYSPVSCQYLDRCLHIWMPYESGKRYFISADVARGDGKDYSAAHVWNMETMEQVAEYYGKIPPDEFARLLCEIGHQYGSCLMIVENNMIGLATLEHIRLLGYENLYYSRKGDSGPGEAINTKFGTISADLVPGFTTSSKTRSLMMSKMEEYFRNRLILVRSKRTVSELRTFIWNNGRAESMRGYNDDLVVSMAIGVWIRETVLSSQFATADMQIKLLESISCNKVTNVQIGASKDPRFSPARTLGSVSQQHQNKNVQTNSLVLPNGQILDLSWLIKTG